MRRCAGPRGRLCAQLCVDPRCTHGGAWVPRCTLRLRLVLGVVAPSQQGPHCLHAAPCASQEEAEQLQRQLEKAEAEQARLQEALAARDAEQQQREAASTTAHEAQGARLSQAEAALAAAAEEAARLQAELAAREAAYGERLLELESRLAAAADEAAQLRQELAASEAAREGRSQQVEGRLAEAAQAEAALQAAAEEASRLQAELAAREAKYEGRIKAMEAGQQLITKRLLVLEGDEEACGCGRVAGATRPAWLGGGQPDGRRDACGVLLRAAPACCISSAAAGLASQPACLPAGPPPARQPSRAVVVDALLCAFVSPTAWPAAVPHHTVAGPFPPAVCSRCCAAWRPAPRAYGSCWQTASGRTCRPSAAASNGHAVRWRSELSLLQLCGALWFELSLLHCAF